MIVLIFYEPWNENWYMAEICLINVTCRTPYSVKSTTDIVEPRIHSSLRIEEQW
jgi:hypothetical protein